LLLHDIVGKAVASIVAAELNLSRRVS